MESRGRWRSLPQLHGYDWNEHVETVWAKDIHHPEEALPRWAPSGWTGHKEEKCQIICWSLGPCDLQASECRDHPGSFEKNQHLQWSGGRRGRAPPLTRWGNIQMRDGAISVGQAQRTGVGENTLLFRRRFFSGTWLLAPWIYMLHMKAKKIKNK